MKNFIKIFLLVTLLSSCANQLKPDLARLYKDSNSRDTQKYPVVLIHGIMGSKLRDKKSLKEVWFGNLRELIFSNYDDIGLTINSETLEPMPSNLEAYAIAGKVAGIDYYHAIIDTLQQFGGYKLTQAEDEVSETERHLYVFTYDWRQDNVKSAKKLNDYIEKIQSHYKDKNQKVDLVAHSMGGLVSRYYLRYGDVDVLNGNDFPVNLKGAENVRKVVLLGTPNFGSVGAVESFITGLKIGLRKIPTEVLVTMPSVYQLFPHSINSWVINIDGNTLDRDVFDSEIWERFQWSIFDEKVQKRILNKFNNPEEGQEYLATLKRYFNKHLERARRFLWSLSVPVNNHKYSIIVMGGDCSLTPAKLMVEEVDSISVTRLKPEDIINPKKGVDYQSIMLEPGDGTVTKASLLARNTLNPSVKRHKYSFFPLDYPYFLCEEHRTLTTNINFEDNLLHILLSQ